MCAPNLATTNSNRHTHPLTHPPLAFPSAVVVVSGAPVSVVALSPATEIAVGAGVAETMAKAVSLSVLVLVVAILIEVAL